MSSKSQVVDYFKLMSRIRSAEELAAKHYFENKIFSFVHFALGQEMVGAALGLSSTVIDHFIGNHRSHHHFLGKGGSAFSMFSEMLGKESGCAKGRGGSMHMFDPTIGFVGTSPILSSAVPIALGDSKAKKESRDGSVTVVFTGDGASEEGNFYESLNLASLWELPIVIVVEDNKYAVNSTQSVRRPSSFDMENLASTFGVGYHQMTSSQPISALDTASEAVALARTGRPQIIHARVTRFLAHSAPIKDDGAAYRLEDMEIERTTLDPLNLTRSFLQREGIPNTILDEIEEAGQIEMREALQMAVNSKEPQPWKLREGIYAQIH